jgi:hypothetical protein
MRWRRHDGVVGMNARQCSRRRTIRWSSAITGLFFITITLLAPAIAGWITQ